MKKLIAALMTVLFLGSTTGLVLAQGTAPAGSPAKTSTKSHKKSKKGKKSKKSMTAPAAGTTAPAAK